MTSQQSYCYMYQVTYVYQLQTFDEVNTLYIDMSRLYRWKTKFIICDSHITYQQNKLNIELIYLYFIKYLYQSKYYRHISKSCPSVIYLLDNGHLTRTRDVKLALIIQQLNQMCTLTNTSKGKFTKINIKNSTKRQPQNYKLLN